MCFIFILVSEKLATCQDNILSPLQRKMRVSHLQFCSLCWSLRLEKRPGRVVHSLGDSFVNLIKSCIKALSDTLNHRLLQLFHRHTQSILVWATTLIKNNIWTHNSKQNHIKPLVIAGPALLSGHVELADYSVPPWNSFSEGTGQARPHVSYPNRMFMITVRVVWVCFTSQLLYTSRLPSYLASIGLTINFNNIFKERTRNVKVNRK